MFRSGFCFIENWKRRCFGLGKGHRWATVVVSYSSHVVCNNSERLLFFGNGHIKRLCQHSFTREFLKKKNIFKRVVWNSPVGKYIGPSFPSFSFVVVVLFVLSKECKLLVNQDIIYYRFFFFVSFSILWCGLFCKFLTNVRPTGSSTATAILRQQLPKARIIRLAKLDIFQTPICSKHFYISSLFPDFLNSCNLGYIDLVILSNDILKFSFGFCCVFKGPTQPQQCPILRTTEKMTSGGLVGSI